MESTIQTITQKILSSKKYKGLYDKTIERIVKNSIEKYGEKHAEEKARNVLHQIWGAYYPIQTSVDKLTKNFTSAFEEELPLKKALLPILSLHASTNERISLLDDFYKKIFAITDMPLSIIDHGCGFNPLTIPWMELPQTCIYRGFDISETQTVFLNNILHANFTMSAETETQDIFVDSFPYADIVFMFKLLPTFEQQQKNSSLEIMRKQKCTYLVVSFPVKSIGGKEKGMTEFYTQKFLSDIAKENWDYQKLDFPTELVFVVRTRRKIA